MDGTEMGMAEPAKSRDVACSSGVLEEITHRGDIPVNHCSSLVESSWERCISTHKLDRSRHKGPEIVTAPEFKSAAAPLDLLTHVARADLEGLIGRLASLNYVIMLSDPNGIALDVLGATPSDRALRRVGVCTGALWGEDQAGTNGIGTSLASRSPVTIHRSQHFFPNYSGLTCTATPIFDSQGQIIAALDASSVADLPQEMQSFVLDLVTVAAHRIERRYFLERNRDRTILRIESGLARVQEGSGLMLALDDNGCAVEMHGADSTDLHMPARDGIIGKPPSGFLEISWQDADVHGDDALLERIGIARLRDSGRPCFASLMSPKCRHGGRLKSAKAPPFQQSTKAPLLSRKSKLGALGLDALAGADPVMCEHVRTIKKLVDKRLPILLQGETGTGKEEFARGIHEVGARSSKPFIVIDCSSIPESLIESELFGYETGTFTGARREGRKGRIAEANGGTLFLDEIGDMPLALQTRLLRVLAQGEVMPLGTAKPMKVDFDIVCASHQDLSNMISGGRFRQDLYYRIAGLRLELPPLRERKDKVEVILGALAIEAAHMELASPPRLSTAALNVLLAHEWPGNMRELRLAMRYALACSSGDVIEADRLPRWLNLDVQDVGNGSLIDDAPTAPDLIEVLQRNQWCVSDAACELRVSRQTLYRWLKKQNINRPG